MFSWLFLKYTAVRSQVGGTNLKLYPEIKAFQVYPLWEHLGGPEKDQILFWDLFVLFYILSPWILLMSWASFGMIVTHFMWMTYKFVSSKSPTRYA